MLSTPRCSVIVRAANPLHLVLAIENTAFSLCASFTIQTEHKPSTQILGLVVITRLLRDETRVDSISNAAGRHAAEANWDATCNVLNYAVLVAFKPANELVAPECKQSFGIICPPYNPPDTFQTFEFVTKLTDEGSALIIDVAFQTQYPLSGLAIADDHGNVYKPVYGGHAAEGTYVCCFVCPSGSGGVLTVTLTAATSIDGAYWFADLSVTFGEYAGLMDALPFGPWVPGDLFGGGYVDATGVCDAAFAGAGRA